MTGNNSRSYLPSTDSSNDTTFVVVITILGLLAVITAGLLLHLCFFHVYISFLGLTTYEYIRQQRQNQLSETISQGKLPNGSATFQLRPVNLYCSEVKTKTTFFSCTGTYNKKKINKFLTRNPKEFFKTLENKVAKILIMSMSISCAKGRSKLGPL